MGYLSSFRSYRTMDAWGACHKSCCSSLCILCLVLLLRPPCGGMRSSNYFGVTF